MMLLHSTRIDELFINIADKSNIAYRTILNCYKVLIPK
jgi:hypothetical protein